MTAGEIGDCDIFGNYSSRNQQRGLGVRMTGGTITGSRIFGNRNGSTDQIQGVGLYLSGGTVENTRISSNGMNGVYNTGGTLRNCLVFGHAHAGSSFAGLFQSNGHLYHCTIADNLAAGETTGCSGLQMADGVAVGNIVHGNGPAGGTYGSCFVTGGTFNTNVIDKAQATGTGNLVANPLFVNRAANDYHLQLGSPAVDAGASVAGILADFDGTARPQGDRPDIGAYERIPAAGALACGITVPRTGYPLGAAPVAHGVAEGTNLAALVYSWYLDGAATPAQTGASGTFMWTGAAAGTHSIRLVVANAAGETAACTLLNAFTIYPLAVFVGWDGSDVYPYTSAATAAHSLNAAYNAVWKAIDFTGTVTIASGTYPVTETLAAQLPVLLVGAGADATILNGAACPGRGLYLAHAGAAVSGVTLTGFTNSITGTALHVAAGEIRDSRITRNCHRTPSTGATAIYGGGAYLAGGTILRCSIDNNLALPNYGHTCGVGVYMTGGTLKDSDVFGQYVNRNQQKGVGVFMSGGSVTGCRIFGNLSANLVDVQGAGLHVTAGSVENSDIFSNGINGVYNTGGTLRNCLVHGHGADVDTFAGVYQKQGLLLNCTIADNVALADTTGVSGLEMTAGTAVNNIVFGNGPSGRTAGSCRIEDGTFNTNLVDVAVPIGTGNLVSSSPFVSRGRADYHIRASSAAYNAGDNGVWASLTDPVDFAGNPRILFKTCDIGAYECAIDSAMLMILR